MTMRDWFLWEEPKHLLLAHEEKVKSSDLRSENLRDLIADSGRTRNDARSDRPEVPA
jgi:hypothetical protein